MPRFPVAFSRRKSSVDNTDHASVTGPSFRVLDRSELSGATKSSDSDHVPRPPAVSRTTSNNFMSDSASGDDNIFADLKNDIAYSNTFHLAATDTGAQQNTSFSYQESKHAFNDVPPPPVLKTSAANSFLKSAGRTFSFGQKKPPSYPHAIEEALPEIPPKNFGRDRAATSSTASIASPPKLDEEFSLDLGGDFSKMVGGFDKRGSGVVRNEGPERLALAPRSLTGNRLNQPTPIQVDNSKRVEPSPYSWGSHASNDGLLNSPSNGAPLTNENTPPPVPRHVTLTDSGSDAATTAAGRSLPASGSAPVLPHQPESGLRRSSAIFGRRRSTIDTTPEPESEDTVLLKDSFTAVSKFLTGSDSTSQPSAGSTSRFRRNEDSLVSGYKQLPTEGSPVEESLFDLPLSHPAPAAQRTVQQPPAQAENKVMTPEQFERYRKDKELESTRAAIYMEHNDADGHDEDNYEEEDEDDVEKLRMAAKQRRKQEAHMTIYRQQMMKVTGEAASGTPTRSSMHMSASTPNLSSIGSNTALGVSVRPQQGGSDGSDDDEEVPLAILAAHGFPNKNRPPTRLSTMMSNPNLRAAAAPSYQRPGSAMGDAPAGSNGRLPPFARNLPQDPYGLVSPPIRESLHFGAGSPASSPLTGGSMPPGGLVGVIANEERSRAMRRGSPAVDSMSKPLPSSMTGHLLDPMAGIPPHMMYPGMVQPQMLSAGEQAQIQMTQQMQQFMQMQMQFMQMMAANNSSNGMGSMPQGPEGQYAANFGGMGMNPAMSGAGLGGGGLEAMRHSFMDNGSVMDFSGQRQDSHMRSMSMVQPSSASWVQPLGAGMGGGYTPSIRVQGANGYAPSIAPSERSNVGLPGRYRPVSHVPAASQPSETRKSVAMTSVLGTSTGNAATSNASSTPGTISPGWDTARKQTNRSPLNNSTNADEDDDDEQGWAAMKEKREKKRSVWKSKKIIGSEIGALIS